MTPLFAMYHNSRYINLQLICLRRIYCVQSKQIVSAPNAANTSHKILQEEKLANEWIVPKEPTVSTILKNKLPPRTKIDADTIALLERLSLVDCANRKGIETLEEAITFADQILQIDTEGVDPLVTVLEDRPLIVRDDEVTEGNNRNEILSYPAVTEDEYFVAPPGNIPLEPRKNLLHEE